MTLKGRIFMCLTFLFLGGCIGLYGGFQWGKANTGNQVTNNYNGKNKIKDSVDSGVSYDQENSQNQGKESASWWQFWK